MTTAIHLTNVQSSERHKYGRKLARLANALVFHLAELNAVRANERPFINRVKHALNEYNEAADDASEFKALLGCTDPDFPHIRLDIQGEIEYDCDALDYACKVLSELGEEDDE